MLGAGSSWAEAVKVYSSSFGSSTCYSEGVYTSAQNYSNLMSIMEFTAGDLSSYSEFTIVVSNFTKADGTSGGAARIRFASGSDTEVKQINIFSGGTKTFKLHEKGTDENGVYYLGDVDLSSVNKVMFGGGGSGDNVGCKATFGTSNVYLTHKTLTRDDASSPINITSADDWGALKALVEGSFTSTQYSDMNAKLTDSFSVTSTIGTSAKPYSGTFDGAGHTLTFTYSDANGEYIAPFQYAQNATFNNLLTAGSISAKNMLGGIIANACGTCTLNNCGSTMTLAASNGTNDSRVGGLVARCADNSTPGGTGITLNYCAYNGNISSSNNQTCGFIGWVRTVTATLNYCLAAPTSDVTGGGQNVASTGNGGTVNATNTYYTKKFGTSTQATAATAVQLASGSLAYDLNTGNTGTLFFGQGNLNKSNIEACPTLTSDATKKVYKLKPAEVNTVCYVNSQGAVPNPVRYGALAWSWSGDGTICTQLPVITEDKTDKLFKVYDKYVLNVSAAGATTLVLPFDAELPSGVTAYDISYTTGDKVTAKSVNKITANKPVLINAAEGTYTFTVSNSKDIKWSGATVSNGALTGVYVQNDKSGDYNPIAYVPANSYVLQNGAEGLGFYKVAADNTIKITSFRAYLTAGTNARSLSIDFEDDNTTAIKQMRTSMQEFDAYFNLSGQRVAQPTKGLYIVNGKKVIIK